MINMLLNILIGLAGWAILALVAAMCIGNALRVCTGADGTAAPVHGRRALRKPA
jgi:hypothetical protein